MMRNHEMSFYFKLWVSVVSVQRLTAMYKAVTEMYKDHVPMELDVETLTAIIVITAKDNHVLWLNASN